MADATILIVDDDRTIVRLCQSLLERASYQVITALDPIDALKILERQHVDLLLSDIRMPIMDGFELVSQAKQLQPDLPVLVMTGYGSIENAIQALHRGVEGLILKPFENALELVDMVQNVLEESRQKRDAARLQALRPLFDVTEKLLAETSPDPLERLILNALIQLFQASHASIFRLAQQRTELEVIRTSGQSFAGKTAAFHQQIMQWLQEDGSSLIVNVNGPGPSETMQTVLAEAGMGGVLLTAVGRNNTQVVFCACREKTSPPFTEADLEMMLILARQADVAMENARLYSELKDTIRRVEESQRALVQAEKMAAVGRLMASLAHEINNPLQAVRNCLHLAERNGLDEAQRLQYLDMTGTELERLVSTVRRMLDFYRLGGLEKNPARIEAILDQVLGILQSQFREQGIHVNVQYAGESREIMLVPDQIQQVIFNLLLNAVDAMENTTGTEIWVDVYYDPQRVRIDIEDSGPGVPPDLQERIFEPFVTTKEHGTGLGLSVSYGIMEGHQGSLSVISPRHANGACFEMILPMGVNE